MKNTPLILAAALVASAMVVPVAADPPGHYSITYEFLVTSYFDFKDGVGIYDSGDPDNEFSFCVLKLLGLRGIQPIGETWTVDQNMGTNLNGPAVGISNLDGTEIPGGGVLHPKKTGGGIPTPIPCPEDIGGAGGFIHLTWHGMNWRSAEHDSLATLTLCTQKVTTSSTPGCMAFPSPLTRLWVSACGDQAGADHVDNWANRNPTSPGGIGNQPDWATANFGGDYADAKGKYAFGEPFDTLGWKSDVIKCPVRKTVNYTTTVLDFTAGQASQTFDLIKNEAVVHNGHGTTYMVVCWQIEYVQFDGPISTLGLAQAHDWKLIWDLGDPDNNKAPLLGKRDPKTPSPSPIPGGTAPEIAGGTLIDALAVHYGPGRVGDNSVPVPPAPTQALRGFYSQDSGDPKDGGAPDGQNGFGPCDDPDQEWDSPAKLKKPEPLL